MRGGANRDAPRTVPIERKLPFLNLNAPLENGEHYFFKKTLASNRVNLYTDSSRMVGMA